MNTLRVALPVLAGLLLTTSSDSVQAQHHRSHYSPGYHIDHHDHVLRDAYGHVIDRYHHNVVHRNSTYILPRTSCHGTYFVRNGHYYHAPRLASLSGQVALEPTEIRFGAFSHIDDLASRLEELTNEFCLDLYYNYQHNHEFHVTYAEAYELLQVARYIHAAEHQHDRDAIRSRLNGMDALFHHLQDDVHGWHRHHHRQIGTLGIVAKMDMIESTLHHLMHDVGVHATDTIEQAPVPATATEQAPPPVTLP